MPQSQLPANYPGFSKKKGVIGERNMDRNDSADSFVNFFFFFTGHQGWVAKP
jgi:hypothetical protein